MYKRIVDQYSQYYPFVHFPTKIALQAIFWRFYDYFGNRKRVCDVVKTYAYRIIV